ncbi:AAA family ATPase [Mycobacterium sp. MBM]|nr:AAA family ATPase [Mycobacterium sp. MBM]
MDAAPAILGRATITQHADTAATLHETHTGIVVLVGERAYKAKKPVVTDFLDFSTPQSREHACQREITLNRRLAPSSYLGVAHLSDVDGGAPEPVIVMRRHPDANRLSTMVRDGQPVADQLGEIAGVLARFHATAERGRQIDACATLEALSARWRENLTELNRYTGRLLSADAVTDVERMATRFLAGRAVLFAQRILERRILDGHGDLLATDIFCMPDGPAMLDCLEFDDQLRYVDGIDDAAFLAMDLEFLGRGDLGAHFLGRYRTLAEDPAPAALQHFYIGYRALVRTKVDCIRADQGSVEAVADARRHLDIAVAHLRAGTVQLIIVGGGPGTGKTTVSRALAEELGAQIISTDDVRRELHQRGVIAGAAGDAFAGLYAPANVDIVYDEILRRAHLLLAGGHSVILDGTWRDPRHRASAHRVGAESAAPVLEFLCTTTLDEAISRIETRTDTTSDATPEIAAELTAVAAQWNTAHRLDTGRPLRQNVEQAQQICRSAV